jgi:hypothetical protein
MEIARTKHRQLVDKHMRLMAKRDKIIERLVRAEANMLACRRAIARSQKRLDKLVAAKTHNNGPTASAVPNLIEAISPYRI